MEDNITIKKGLTGVWVMEDRSHLGTFSVSSHSRRVSWMTRELVDGEIDRIIDKDDVGFMKLALYRARKQFKKDAIAQERLIWGSRAERVNEIVNKLK